MRLVHMLAAAVALLLALPGGASNQTCMIADMAFGAPTYGCCHFGRVAVAVCDPSASDAQDAADAQERCTEVAALAPRSETRTLSTWSDCKSLCDAEPACVIWSFEASARDAVSQTWQPATCMLVSEGLNCRRPVCAKPGAAVGQKDCQTDHITSEEADSDAADSTAEDAAHLAKPLCDSRAPVPEAVGTLTGSQMDFDAGCRYELYDRPSTMSCLRGTWVVIVGGSNSILMTIQLANQIAPGTFHPTLTNAGTFRASILDAVYEDGNRLYSHNALPIGMDWDWSDNLGQLGAVLNRAPGHAANRIRITEFVGQFWPNVGSAVDIVQANQGWAAADVILVTQISQWYYVCGVYRFDFCHRRELMLFDEATVMSIAREEMRDVIDNKLQSFCAPGGRASRGCLMMNNAYDPGQRAAMTIMNQLMQDVMSTRASSQIQFLDAWALGEGAPQESMEAHSSPIVMHWTWQVILASVCAGSANPPSEGNFATFAGPTCFAGTTLPSYSQCTTYTAGCGMTCSLWECAHSEQCTFETVNSSALVASHGGGGASCMFQPDVRLRWALAGGTDSDDGGSCRRVVCDEALEIVWPVVSVLLALVALAVQFRDKLVPGKTAVGKFKEAPAAGADPPQDGEASPNTVVSPQDAEKPAEVEEAREARPQKAAAASADRFPLGLARFLASLHVVLGHLQGRGAVDGVYFFGWGFTWVPWFFMLSGFVLCSAELRRPTKESILQYVSRRSVTIYPLYAFSLLPSFAIQKYLGRAPDWGYLISQVWLVQAWVPHLTEHVLQTHCWFLSCMVVYWVAFLPIARVMKKFSLMATVASMIGLFVLPWLAVIIPAAVDDLEWYSGHTTGEIDEQVNVWVVFLKFHPITYFHVFLLGMLLAKLRHQLDSRAQQLRYIMEAMMPLGYLVIILVMAVEPIRPWSAKLSMRLSIVLPCQAAILLGLAGLPSARQPLVAQLASRVEFLADYSYSVYIFQWICYYLWPTGDHIFFTFFIFLVATAVLMQIVVQLPAQYAWKRWPYARPAVPLLLCIILGGFSALPDREVTQSSGATVTQLPARVEPASGMTDLRLELSPADDEGGVLMNTALLVDGDELVVAARRHKLEYREYQGTYNGSAVTIIDEVYSSQITLGRGAFDATFASAPSVAVSNWTGLRTPAGGAWSDLCVRERYIESNNTLIRKVVTGPEDPKLFAHRGSVSLVFNSLPPLGAGGCAHPLGANQQMYLANGISATAPEQPVTGRRIRCGFTRRDEKNWIPFHRNGLLYMIYSPHPHQVAVVQDSGECVKPYTTNYAPFARLVQGRPNLHIRGSGQAYIIEQQRMTTNMPIRHGVALFHIYDSDTGLYAHFAYRFNPEPPFEILQISRQLPLQISEIHPGGPKVAFVSGFLVRQGQVLISYSAGDRDPRVLAMDMWTFDGLFEQCGVETDLYTIFGRSQARNFTEAAALCQAHGKHLAVVDSYATAVDIYRATAPKRFPYWIGLHEMGRQEGDWVWVDGSPLIFENWFMDEKYENFNGVDEECAAINIHTIIPQLPASNQWFSLPCDSPLGVVCT